MSRVGQDNTNWFKSLMWVAAPALAFIALCLGGIDPILQKTMPRVARGAANLTEVHSRRPNPPSPPSTFQNGRLQPPGDTLFPSPVDLRPMVAVLATSADPVSRRLALDAGHRDPAQLLGLARGGETEQIRLTAWSLWCETWAARLDVLLAALSGEQAEKSPRVRGHLARLIRTLGGARAADHLVRALLAEKQGGIQRRLITELIQSGPVTDPGALLRLTSQIKDPSLRERLGRYLVRGAVDQKSQVALRDAIFASWSQLTESEREMLLAAVGLAERQQLVGELSARVRDSTMDPALRARAIRTLVSLGGNSIAAVIDRTLVTAAQPGLPVSVRLAAIDGLGRIGHHDEVLGRLLSSDRSPAVRARAAARVAANDDSQVGLLIEAASTDASPAVRASALLRLAGASRSNDSVLSIVHRALVGGGEEQVRLSAGRALVVLLRRRRQKITSSGRAAIVRLAREGELPRTRLGAVDQLAMLGDGQSLQELAQLSRSSADRRVRARARQMLALAREER